MPKRWIFLSLAALYCIGLGLFFSSRHLMVLDELFAWNIIHDPTFHHGMQSWNRGADGGGILFYASLWPIAHWSNGSVMATRFPATLFFLLAGVVWWRVLSRFLDTRWAAVGVTLVFLASDTLLYYIDLIRFYELFILFAALSVWSILYATEESSPPLLAALFIFLSQAGMILTHMLGVMFSALLIAVAFVCLFPHRRWLLITLSGLCSWLTLLPCRAAIHISSINAQSQGKPVLRDLARYYLKIAIAPPVTLVALFGLYWLIRDLRRRYRATTAATRRTDPAFFAPVLCLTFLTGPIGGYLISVIARPVAEPRYFITYYLSLAALVAYAFQHLASRQPGQRLSKLQTADLIVLIAALHLYALYKLPPGPSIEVGNLAQLAQHRPVVVMDEAAFFELQHYRSTPDLQFHFVIAPTWAATPSLMTTVAQRGYYPGSISRLDLFEQEHPDFLMLVRRDYKPSWWFPNQHTCQPRALTILSINSAPADVFELSHCTLNPKPLS